MIRKITDNEHIKLYDYDALITLPEGIFIYNMLDVNEDEFKKFIKEHNLFSDTRIEGIKFITSPPSPLHLERGGR